MQNQDLIYKAGTFALFAVGLCAIMGMYYLYTNLRTTNQRTFSVSGSADAFVKANKASVHATFYSEGKDQKTVSEDLAKKVNNMFTSLEGLSSAKINKKDIKTESVNITPKYEYCSGRIYISDSKPCNGESRIVGYTASEYVTIKLEKNEDGLSIEEKAGKMLGVFSELGARDVSGPAWESDTKPAVEEARQKAVDEARGKAEAIANSLGMKLGKVVNYNENQGGGIYPMMYAAKAEMAGNAGVRDAVSVPVSSGEEKVTLTVNVTYELK